jgi:hypothetical protein
VWPLGESFTNYVSLPWIEVVQPCVNGMPAFITLTTVSNTHIGLIWSGLVWCRPFWRVHSPGYEVLTPVKVHTIFMEAACFCRGERSRDIYTQRVQWTLVMGSGDCKEWPWSVVDVTVGNQLPLQPHKLVKGEVEIAVPSTVHGERIILALLPGEGPPLLWIGGSTVSRAGLDTVEKRRNLLHVSVT